MYWLDTTILFVLGAGAIFGAVTGLLMQLARLAGFVISLYAAVYFNEGTAALLQEKVMQEAEPWLTYLLAYLFVFLIVYLAIYLLTLTLERGLTAVRLQVLNRLLGALLGASKLALLLGGVFLGVACYPSDSTRDMLRRSTLAPLLAEGTESVVGAVVTEWGADWDEAGSSLRQAVEREAAAR
jgi:uncharacterized membrane protein required for colicin V production